MIRALFRELTSSGGVEDELAGEAAAQVLGSQGVNQTADSGMGRRDGYRSYFRDRLDMTWQLIRLGKRWRGCEERKVYRMTQVSKLAQNEGGAASN